MIAICMFWITNIVIALEPKLKVRHEILPNFAPATHANFHFRFFLHCWQWFFCWLNLMYTLLDFCFNWSTKTENTRNDEPSCSPCPFELATLLGGRTTDVFGAPKMRVLFDNQFEVMTFDNVIMSSRHFRNVHVLFQPLYSQLHGIEHEHHGWFGCYGVEREMLHCIFCTFILVDFIVHRVCTWGNGTIKKTIHKLSRWTVQNWVLTPRHDLRTKQLNESMKGWFPFFSLCVDPNKII